jgi:hypothetical protein
MMKLCVFSVCVCVCFLCEFQGGNLTAVVEKEEGRYCERGVEKEALIYVPPPADLGPPSERSCCVCVCVCVCYVIMMATDNKQATEITDAHIQTKRKKEEEEKEVDNNKQIPKPTREDLRAGTSGLTSKKKKSAVSPRQLVENVKCMSCEARTTNLIVALF